MRQNLGGSKDPGRVDEAVKVLYSWAKESQCPVRTCLRVLSAGGGYFSASCYDSLMQGLAMHGSVTSEGPPEGVKLADLQACARRRLCPSPSSASPGVTTN